MSVIKSASLVDIDEGDMQYQESFRESIPGGQRKNSRFRPEIGLILPAGRSRILLDAGDGRLFPSPRLFPGKIRTDANDAIV
jgi:hypothetical protein